MGDVAARTDKWEALKECALASLDAKGEERLSSRRRYALKTLKKMGGAAVPFDDAKVVRFLTLYADGKRYTDAVDEAGATKQEIVTAFDLWPEAKAVFEYVRDRNARSRELDNEELVDEARRGLRKLLKVEDCKINAKAVLTTLERLDRKSFGDPRVKFEDGDAAKAGGPGGITVNIIGDAAKACATPPEKPTGKAAVFIDV